jgi:ribosomal protein S18 acetylase RimI-like enzyme
MSILRTLMPSDLPSAMRLSIAANWNQTAEDWLRVMRLAPNGCRCIESEAMVVATATRLNYEDQLAWIGMVLTKPEDRRKGHARQLIEDAIASSEVEGIRTLKLDATEQGRPLYESVGFVVEQIIERWERKGEAPNATTAASTFRIGDELVAQDARAFGVSRKRLLQDLLLSGHCAVGLRGYALSRPGRIARYLGPCVTTSADAARELIKRHLNTYQPGCAWYWDLLPSNAEVVRCAEELGFVRTRMLWRMRLGEPIDADDSLSYAIAGFELG